MDGWMENGWLDTYAYFYFLGALVEDFVSVRNVCILFLLYRLSRSRIIIIIIIIIFILRTFRHSIPYRATSLSA